MATSLTVGAVRDQIASQTTGPLYVLLGDDEREKSELAAEFANAIEEDLRAFNVDRFYGGETDAAAVIEAACTVPMLASRRVVVVLRAERLLCPRRESADAARDLTLLERYVESPRLETTLVLASTSLDERRRISQLLLARAALVFCGALEGRADVERWIRKQAAAEKRAIDPEAVRSLADRAGPDAARLRRDFERLMLYTLGREVTPQDVVDVVGPATSQDDWAVTRAIERRDAPGALRELALLLDAGTHPLAVLGQIGWCVRTKLPEPRVTSDALDAILRTDLAMKQSGDPRLLLERLVVELCR